MMGRIMKSMGLTLTSYHAGWAWAGSIYIILHTGITGTYMRQEGIFHLLYNPHYQKFTPSTLNDMSPTPPHSSHSAPSP